MQAVLKVVGAGAVIVASFFATLWIYDFIWPLACYGSERIELKRPFTQSSGNAFLAPLPKLSSIANNPQNPGRSTLKLCENGKLIGPPHIPLVEIAASGRGRFTHWGDGVFFSSSDNSDPNTNGRLYVVAP